MIIRQHWYWNSRELIKYAEGLWPWGTLPQLHNIRSRSWQRDIIIWCQETRGSVPSCLVPQCWYIYEARTGKHSKMLNLAHYLHPNFRLMWRRHRNQIGAVFFIFLAFFIIKDLIKVTTLFLHNLKLVN